MGSLDREITQASRGRAIETLKNILESLVFGTFEKVSLTKPLTISHSFTPMSLRKGPVDLNFNGLEKYQITIVPLGCQRGSEALFPVVVLCGRNSTQQYLEVERTLPTDRL